MRALPRMVRKIRQLPPSVTPLLWVVAAYGAMLLTSFGMMLFDVLFDISDFNEEALRHLMTYETATAEWLDTMIAVAALAIAGIPKSHCPSGYRLMTWLLAIPGFFILFGFNVAFHLGLKFAVEAVIPPDSTQTAIELGLRSDGWIAILLVCVQPAIVEEFFFRYIFLGHLRPHMSMHATVWLTAFVFGVAHLGAPIGWPVLIVLGAGLGYARVYSAGMTLPIVLHFLHNLAVMGVDDIMKG